MDGRQLREGCYEALVVFVGRMCLIGTPPQKSSFGHPLLSPWDVLWGSSPGSMTIDVTRPVICRMRSDGPASGCRCDQKALRAAGMLALPFLYMLEYARTKY